MMLVLLCFFLFVTVAAATAPVGSVPMRVVNLSGKIVELYWVDTFTAREPGEEYRLVKQTTKPLRNTSDTTINSYTSHKFVVRLLKHEAGVEAFFLKGSSDETVTVSYDPVTRNLTVVQKTKLDELMDKIKAATKDCDKLDGEAFSDCVSDVILKDIAKLTESKELMIGYRDVMADRLRNYVCQDPAVENSNSTSKTSYVDTSKKSFSSSNYLDTNHAKIWVIDDFVSEEECASLIAAHRASSLVPVNNTLVGHHKIPASTSTDSIRLIHNRVREVFGHSGRVGQADEGQEDMYTISYYQGGEKETECDGVCDGRLPIPGARVATAVLQCQVPEIGGVVVFPKADVVIRVPKYSGLFVTYLGTDGLMDEGFVERSECPVLEGDKFQAVIHLRNDVSAEHNWQHFVALHEKRLLTASVGVDMEGGMPDDFYED